MWALLLVLRSGEPCLMTVSYTHLDVYKRQVKPMGPTRCSRAPVAAQVREMLPVFWGICGSTSTIFNGFIDVYKRQMLYSVPYFAQKK